ncbi:ATPase family AAA domain-containing protein 2 [Anabrus simplex]|uniref:ATPase family AAA domain-containing protein 2 n=1 Tax=Anabrus simplex TaxID=316456 RepID=UPI0035A3366F
MVKTRSCDINQDLNAVMPVKDSLSIKENSRIIGFQEGGSDNSHRESEKDESYSPQTNSVWGRELRNRFVFSSNERSRSSGDCALHSRYGKQGISSSRHIRSCRIPVSLDERGRVYEEDEMMDDSDDIGLFDAPDDDDDIFTPSKRRYSLRLGRVRRGASCRRRVRRSHVRRRATDVTTGSSSRVLHPRHLAEEVAEPQLNGHDSSLEIKQDDNHEGEGVRRSTRQRKLLYDNFNTSWILGTQTLRGYPMFMVDKDKPLVAERSADVDEKKRAISELEQADDDVSKERASVPRSNYSYEDMYTRVKRPRRQPQNLMAKPSSQKLLAPGASEEEAMETQSSQSSTDDESGGEGDGPREKYHLRKTKPTVDRFQANIDPPRRSNRILRSVLCNSVRRIRHRPAREVSSSSSSDDERFDRKKAKGLSKSRSRCMPINMHPDDMKTGSHLHDSQKLSKTLADVEPMILDTSIGFRDVGGLEMHIRCLQEMVVFPMLYREVFERFGTRPPKGVLFHGPPGTGKTLIARALANECSRSDRKVSFFMRKGADCLCKWVGESERQLRLLFEQAYQMRPSIIFFDEIDGLAPVRSSKQDQIHASIVSTLLALMDGLDDRGEIIVIGATNRIDAIDPALRRPGRFDRELYFPLPAKKERQEILRIHVSQWAQPPSPALLNFMAEQAAGYCGSDLRALCSEAVVQGLRRCYPQIYHSSHKLLVDPTAVKVEKVDFLRAKNSIVPAAVRVLPSPGRKLLPLVEPLLKSAMDKAISVLKESFPHGVSRSVASGHLTRTIYRPQLLIVGSSPQQGQTTHLGPALLHYMEHVAVHTLDLTALYQVSGRSPEEAIIQIFQEARRNLPSILYVPGIAQLWSLMTETQQALFLMHLRRLDPSTPVLLFATSDSPYNTLPEEVCLLFSKYRGEVLTMQNPPDVERRQFFSPLFMGEALKPPKPAKKSAPLPELPLAPPPEPRKLSEEEQKTLLEKEEATLRELRIFLREICSKLARNRQFFMFTKPVDVEEVPDYLTIVKQPMDLETMMTKIDLHRYMCAQEFLDDVDLLCRNALEYNPDRDPADKLIRHRACSLRDTAYALIKTEMDSDFEQQCRVIARARRERAESPSRFAPEFVLTRPLAPASKDDTGGARSQSVGPLCNSGIKVIGMENSINSSVHHKPSWKYGGESCLKKRRTTPWARGLLKHGSKKKKCMRRVISLSSSSVSTASPRTDQTCDAKRDAENSCDSNPAVRLNGDLSMEKGNHGSDGAAPSPHSSNSHSFSESLVDDGEAVDAWDTASQEGCDLPLDADGDRSCSRVEQETDVVEINEAKLRDLLTKTVKLTSNFPVEVLLELYVQLSKCVARFGKRWDRASLPQELEAELESFLRHHASFNHMPAR